MSTVFAFIPMHRVLQGVFQIPRHFNCDGSQSDYLMVVNTDKSVFTGYHGTGDTWEFTLTPPVIPQQPSDPSPEETARLERMVARSFGKGV